MLRGRSSKAMGAALWLTLAVVSTVAPAGAQSFSQGKALTLIVGNTAGSGYTPTAAWSRARSVYVEPKIRGNAL